MLPGLHVSGLPAGFEVAPVSTRLIAWFYSRTGGENGELRRVTAEMACKDYNNLPRPLRSHTSFSGFLRPSIKLGFAPL